jgi:hypothetical protein
VYDVSLVKQELGEICAVLACDSCYQGCFCHGFILMLQVGLVYCVNVIVSLNIFRGYYFKSFNFT